VVDFLKETFMKQAIFSAVFIFVSFNIYSQIIPESGFLMPILSSEDEENLMCILPGDKDNRQEMDFIYKNELNPVEEIGRFHNQAMDHLDRVLGEKFEIEELILETSQYFAETQNLTIDVQQELEKSFPSHELVKFVQSPMSDTLFLKAGQNAAKAISLCLSGFRKRDMSELITFENNILFSKNIQDPEILALMALTSVCRHTAYRNALKTPVIYFDGSEEGETQLLRVEPNVIADAVGALVGAGVAFASAFNAPLCLVWAGYGSTLSSKGVELFL
jgi:hypothetical protein